MLNITIRIVALLCIALRWWYWRNEEVAANTKIPKSERTARTWIKQGAWLTMYYIPVVQVCGLKLFTFLSVKSELIGLIVVIIGTGICLWARKTLAENWANGYEYQVKTNQKLITQDIYGVIRHPIYLGLALTLIGLELIAQSYLSIAYIAIFIAFYFQAKREEKILLAHFGKQYQKYMKTTKMLIPFML